MPENARTRFSIAITVQKPERTKDQQQKSPKLYQTLTEIVVEVNLDQTKRSKLNTASARRVALDVGGQRRRN